jgi:hypothetical protein
MKILLISLYFPPAGGGGVQRPLKLATHLPELGVETHVLAPDDPRWRTASAGYAASSSVPERSAGGCSCPTRT